MAMTFIEAAETLLREAGTALHYKEITRRAIERGLIESQGQTPEATMAVQLYRAIRRAEQHGEPAIFRAAGRGQFALAGARAGLTLDADIVRHNSKVESELLEFLHEMHPRQLELIVGQLLDAVGFEDVLVTKYSGDGGIDVEATLTVGGVTRVRTAIQVKRWKSNVTGSTVRELRGGLMTDQRGLIITTSGFTKDAATEAQAAGKTPISLVDGKRLIELLVENEIGVRRKAVSLLELNVEDLVVEEGGGTDEKSAVLWPLPGGQEHFFQTLLMFLDEIAKLPTLDEITTWVLKHFEKVTKHKLVQSYLRSVLYSMGLIEFDGEVVKLTDQGDELRKARDRATLLSLLEKNVVGVTELLQRLGDGPADTATLNEYLVKSCKLSWETDHQAKYRLQWLAACGAVQRESKKWQLAPQ